MNEKTLGSAEPTVPTAEKNDGLTPEERAMAELFLSDYETEELPKAERVDGAKEAAEFLELLAAFENEHSLEALHAIVDLTAEEAPNHPLREPARKALAPIVAKLNFIKNETGLSAEKVAELEAGYKRLSKAVGIINGGTVRH